MIGGKLGKLPPRHDVRTLLLANYLTTALPEPPPVKNWALKAGSNWGMMLNDRIGDCVLPDTEIVAPNAKRAYRAPYAGPVVDLVTASGKRLSVTANHAVMTTRGFIRARFLRKGDHLVSSSRPESVAVRVDRDFDQIPSSAEDLFCSLRSASILAPSKMSGAVDFHGDAAFFDGDVDVVNADRLLENRKPSALRKPKGHFQFIPRSSDTLLLDRQSALNSGMERVLCAPSSRMGRSGAGLALLRRNPVIANKSSTRLVSQWDASPTQPPHDGAPSDTEFVTKFSRALSGLVSDDELVDVGHRVWSGHVYDYSTQVHWYAANGIFVHNCTCAAAGHAIQTWTANASKELTIPDSAVLAAYERMGYKPSDPSTDQGAVELDVLKMWKTYGIGGVKLSAFMATEPRNHQHVKQAVTLFGGCYIGVALPRSIEGQTVWSVPPGGPIGTGARGSLGGHAVWVVGYDAQGYTCVTWGKLQRMTTSFFDTYVDESFALLSDAWATGGHVAPSGFNLGQLQSDLLALR